VKQLTLLLLLPLAAFAAAPVSDWAPNLTTRAAWLGNIDNGEAVWDRIGALQLDADVLATGKYDLSRVDAVHLTVDFGGNWVPRFNNAGRAYAGGRADWQHTFGHDEFAPIFTIEGGGDYVWAYENGRRGFAGELTLKMTKRFARVWRAGLSERFDELDAHHHVYDSRSNETTVQLGRDFNNDATRLTFTARYRDGDVLTYAQYHRPDLEAIAREFEAVNTFKMPMRVYSAQAKTVAGRIALMHATAEDAAIVLAYEYAQTKGTGVKFANQIVSLSFVHQY
jgi:hypothetical protein